MEAVQKLSQTGSADELEKQAGSVQDSFQRDLVYFKAALAASGAGEFERALSLAGKVSNEDFRGGLESVLRLQTSSELLAKGEIDASLSYAEAMSDVQQRAFQLAKIARSLLERKNTPRASEVLTEAEKTIGRGKDGVEKAQALLLITEVKIRLDPTQGFESMEATVKAFNEADAAPAPKPEVASGIGSMMKTMLAGMFRLGAPDFAPSFYLLARTDFNRAAQLARQLTRMDRSVPAQVAACRGVLIRQPDRRVVLGSR
jgi:tetratricopeptide (TPR) repeat protein